MDFYENERGFLIHLPVFLPKWVGLIKKIKGRQYNPNTKVWSIPLSQRDKVTELYNKYQVELLARAPMKLEPIQPMRDLTDPLELVRVPFPFQNQGIAYIFDHDERCIIADQPGLGKTTQAIGAVVGKNRFPVLIICPSTLKINWQKEWLIVAGKRCIILSDKTRHTWHRYIQSGLIDVVIVNYDSLEKFFVSHINRDKKGAFKVKDVIFNEYIDLFKAVIVDESHKCKDMKVQWTKFTMGICNGKKMRLAVSGTPLVNKTKDLAAQLFIIGRMQDFGGLELFEARYCDTNEFLPELQNKLHRLCFFQRKKSEVLKELPDKIRQVIYCDITTRREYQVALADLAKYLKEYKAKTDVEVRKSMRGEIMVKMAMCKNISARGKLNEVAEWTEELLAAGKKVVLFMNQHDIRRKVLEQFPHALSLTGEQSLIERQENIDRFQNDPRCNLILCGIKLGVGYTLTAAQDVGFIEQPWHSSDRDQCEDRLHRIGQEGSVLSANFIGKNTIDEFMHDLVEEKAKLAGEVTGNEDDTVKEIIDRLADSLFNQKKVDAYEEV